MIQEQLPNLLVNQFVIFLNFEIDNLNISTVLATAKLTSFSFLLKNEDAYLRERKRIFQKTKTHISDNEDAKKTKTQKKRKRKKTKTQKNASLLGHYTKACRLKSALLYVKNV